MKTKLFLTLLFAVTVGGSILAQQNLTVPGSPNYYEGKYGTTVLGKGPFDALVYIDYVVAGPDYVEEGLLNLGYTVTYATDWTDFATKLATGAYGFAVGFNQNESVQPPVAAIQAYVAAGGCMLYTDWTRDNALAGFFEASWTGNSNDYQVTINDPAMAQGLPNPFTCVDQIWSINTMGLTAIGNGEVLATFSDGEAAAVRGNDGKTIILGWLSDVPDPAIRQQLFENVLNVTICGQENSGKVPISDWAIYLSVFLMVSFLVYRFARAY